MPVYFIRSGEAGAVKIGWATNIEARRRQLQVGHHDVLHVIRSIGGARRLEPWLHDRFAALRLIGEWFQFDADMLAVEPPDLGPEPVKLPRPKKKQPAPPEKDPWLVSWAAGRCTVQNPCAQCQVRPLYRPARWGKRRPALVAS